MSNVFSRPVEALIQEWIAQHPDPNTPRVLQSVDAVIVGSGYGASIAAMKLAGLEKSDGTQLSLLVLERGREYAVGEFPQSLGELPGHVRFRRPTDRHPSGRPDALFELRSGADVDVLVGNGLGGGSLINANVAARPLESVFDDAWPERYRNNGLDEAFTEIEKLLGAAPGFGHVDKFGSFSKLAQGLGKQATPANVTVTTGSPYDSTPNAVGLAQPGCSECGNCVTGCNVGSKNTLMMNLIPLARERGAEFVTGANILRVLAAPEPRTRRWRLELQRTRSIRTPLEGERFFVDADFVILAAGTLGSSEILLRSRKQEDPQGEGLDLSDTLGHGFSTNGDGLGFSFGQRQPVHALGTPETTPEEGPGPTITGIVRDRFEGKDGTSHPVSFEDGAVPHALLELYGEALTTGAQLNRIGRNKLPAFFDGRKADPLAFNRDLLEHGQVFLMMTDDRAQRVLALEGPADVADAALRSVFPSALSDDQRKAADAGLEALDRLLTDRDRKAPLEKGQYVPNPLWRLLRRGSGDVLGGRMPEGRNLSVHPLGGCAMGSDVSKGVVDENGQVFDPDGGTHDGLYVMDGAILPGAIATNPFLTISAVAWSCCETLLSGPLAAEGWKVPATRPSMVADTPDALFVPAPTPKSPSARLILREQFLGTLEGEWPTERKEKLEELLEGASRFTGHDGLVLRVHSEPLDPYGDLASLEGGPPELVAKADLWVNPESSVLSRRRGRSGAPTTLLDDMPVATGTARIRILELDRGDGWLERSARAVQAFLAYQARRQVSLGEGETSLWARAVGFVNTALMHANYRRFGYRFELESPFGARITFEGTKDVRWKKGAPRLWDALLNLSCDEFRIERGGEWITAPARFRVDAGYMLDEGLIQIHDTYDLVASAVGAGSLAAFFGRCFLEASFWEFGAPAYPDEEIETDRDPVPLQVAPGTFVEPIEFPLQVPATASPADGSPQSSVGMLDIALNRFPQPNGDPVLLIHGLAQGSAIFWSPKMAHNMARFLWNAGFDVWVLDHRLSHRFEHSPTPDDVWAIDAIGEHDVPRAVEKVFLESGQRPVKIFAHCVGAIGVQMALLSGRLKSEAQGRWVEAVCFNAIHPWIVPATANLVRSKLGAFAGDWIGNGLLDPILQTKETVSGTQSLLDRLGFSLARMGERLPEVTGSSTPVFPPHRVEGHGKGSTPEEGTCDRMTYLYGRMWRHENLEPAVRAGWKDLVGKAPTEVYLQIYYLLERERLLDDEGRNRYLVQDNIDAHWIDIPTFFIHGEESDVFNPQSATRSANRLKIARAEYASRNPGQRVAPIYLRRYEDLGHMDPILAERAHVQVYPDLVRFFEVAKGWHAAPARSIDNPFDPIQAAHDPNWRARPEPETGPAIRSAWIDGNRITIRYWYERYLYNTSRSIGMRAVAISDFGPDHDDVTVPIDMGEEFADFVWADVSPEPAEFRGHEIRELVKGDSVVQLFGRPGFFETQKDVTDLAARINRLLGQLDLLDVSASDPHESLGPLSGDVPGATAEEGVLVPLEAQAPVVTNDQPPWYRRLVEKILGAPGAADRLSFMVGSCRYPGTPVEADLSDRILSGMLKHAKEVDLDMTFFVGDQIYADAYNTLFDNTLWRDHYRDSYRHAFGSKHMAALLKQMPIHFAMDDHEIVDDWSGGLDPGSPLRGRRGLGPQHLSAGGIKAEQISFAKKMACAFMSSAREAKAVGSAPEPPTGAMWYELDHRAEVNFPCFVLDTRSERMLRRVEGYAHGAPGEAVPQMMSEAQLEAFESWLVKARADHEDRPKFVFAGQILAPVSNEYLAQPAVFRSEDSFFGYPDTLARVIERIVTLDVRNLVFVGGDLHLSCAAELTLGFGNASVTAWQIVASGLYSPMPFANARPDHYRWATVEHPEIMSRTPDASLSYRVEHLSSARSHFLHVDVTQGPGGGPSYIVSLQAFASNGEPITREPSVLGVADGMRLELR